MPEKAPSSFIAPAIVCFVSAIVLILIANSMVGCTAVQVDPNADEHLFRHDPDLWWHLHESAIPQDDKMHWSGNAVRVHDQQTGAPVGWELDLAVKFAWPLHEPTPAPAVLRPRVPPKTYPPDR